MAEFITVDRGKVLFEGKKIELITDLTKTHTISIEGMISNDDLEKSFYRNYPNGISLHGQRYLFGYPPFVELSRSRELVQISPMIEAIFEQVRRADFANLPSRFVSMFAWHNLADAQMFKEKYQCHDANLFKVESDEYFLGDMSFLTIGGQVMNTFELAYKYWNGDRTDSPIIEALLPLPTIIGKSIS
ncbi:DUF2441 domain-containing protein [Acinetobacter guillouiae]|uniref:DUF2441 domain-containing protein n=1 Tax=Acinetobacter guillouiae TaxID=106649 RepID=UPI0026E23C5D|nr:DUF2441 domain-containing protein [Acinetobacter guillouiae]MDO6646525.1 DUF2441 domain-containing protein [Acinetobacter guillouiae]